MSHVHNLFHSPSKLPDAPHPMPGPQPVPAPAPLRDVDPGEFPVENATIRPESRIVYHTDPRSPAADRFRFLRMRLRDLGNAGKLKKLLIASPLAGDGKSTVILNLATALSEHGKRSVLVIEADLHNPSLADSLRLPAWAGLTDCLTDDEVSPFSAIRRIEPLGWHFLPAGEPRGNPTEMLQTPAFGRLINRLAPSFDWVLIDSPAVLSSTDSISLHPHADGSLLVARAGQTPRESIEQAVALLGPKKVVGVLLNAVEDSPVRERQKEYASTRGDQQE